MVRGETNTGGRAHVLLAWTGSLYYLGMYCTVRSRRMVACRMSHALYLLYPSIPVILDRDMHYLPTYIVRYLGGQIGRGRCSTEIGRGDTKEGGAWL